MNLSNGEIFAGLVGLVLFLVAIVAAIERWAKVPAQKDPTRDETIGVDQFTDQRRAALPFQYPASKGFEARRPFLDKDRDGQRRRELNAAINTSAKDRIVH